MQWEKKFSFFMVVLTISNLTYAGGFDGHQLNYTGSLPTRSYDQAIGLRFGSSNGLTYRKFVGKSNAVEGILTTRWGGWNVTGLYEFFNETKADGLDWFYGFGATIGQYNIPNDNTYFRESGNQLILGVGGNIGLDYTFDAAPINFSLDFKPMITFSGFIPDELNLSIRYAF